ncbi:MAG TPA: DUF6265 family protein [Bacteroidia bacterium]|nr:DUF6265 family protein [Bacteroidia bacterium]
MKLFSCSILLSLIFLAAACGDTRERTNDAVSGSHTYDVLRKLNWLSGSWSGKSPDGIFGEAWEQANDSVYHGKGFFIVGKDTVSSESLRLVQEGTQLFYEPTVKNQNGGKAVRFEMTSLTENAVVFENPSHDFPQKINYTLVNPDSLVAEISGEVEGKHRSEVFAMARTK